MTYPARHATRRLLLMLALASISLGGCALDRLPRIDPSGQRLLIFPDEPTPPVTPLPQDAAPSLASGATAGVPGAPANTTAPPVYTDPFLPGGPGSTSTTDLLGRTTVIGPPVASSPGAPQAAAPPQPPSDVLSITPSEVLAPVGSEVILIAGVCAESGYLRTNERIEWMLDRAGTGQFVTVGNRGELDIFRLPHNTPRKVDNHFAIGATSPFAQCLDRGTADPNDDVQIRRGDAWITVSSPVEGTSYVTAYAPNVSHWGGRTARATIYWVDAQWAFPPSVTLAPGESHTLTTTVTRQTTGVPIAGWTVRYRVVGDTAGLGYEQGQTAEVQTNADGRASVEITPTDDRPGTTNIEVEVIRPAGAAGRAVTLGRGATSITWADGGISGSPLPTAPPDLPPVDSTPITPDDQPEPTPEPDATPPEAAEQGQPDLVVRIEQRSSGPFRVESEVEFLVTVTNYGNATARDVKIVDEFDVGLETDIAEPGEQVISSDTPFDLAPGESQPLPLVFRATRAGQLSHSVTVTAANAVPTTDRATITVEDGNDSAAAPEPSLRVTLVGPERRTVGETVEFRINIQNTGTVPATNLVVTSDTDPELDPQDASESVDQQHWRNTGQLLWRLSGLEPGEAVDLRFVCACEADAQSTCARVEVAADGLRTPQFDQKCLEIRLQRGAGRPPETTPATGGLTVDITETGVPRVRQRFLLFVRVRNTTEQPQRDVRFRVLIPAELAADRQQIQSSVPVQASEWADGRLELRFGPVDQLRAGQTLDVTIPVDAVRQGTAQLFAESSSAALEPRPASRDIVVLGQ